MLDFAVLVCRCLLYCFSRFGAAVARAVVEYTVGTAGLTCNGRLGALYAKAMGYAVGALLRLAVSLVLLVSFAAHPFGCSARPLGIMAGEFFWTSSSSSVSSYRWRGCIPLARWRCSEYCRCFSAQSEHRVRPSVALLGQSLQRPRSLKFRRLSTAPILLRSLFSSSVRCGLGAFPTGFSWLVEVDALAVLDRGLSALGFLRLVLFARNLACCLLPAGVKSWKASVKSCVFTSFIPMPSGKN